MVRTAKHFDARVQEAVRYGVIRDDAAMHVHRSLEASQRFYGNFLRHVNAMGCTITLSLACRTALRTFRCSASSCVGRPKRPRTTLSLPLPPCMPNLVARHAWIQCSARC